MGILGLFSPEVSLGNAVIFLGAVPEDPGAAVLVGPEQGA